MSDSDTDLLPNEVLTFQSRGTTVSVKGPNINSTNISNLSYRYNDNMTSITNIPWNVDRRRYAESAYDQRSYYRRDRETSPMSLHSASGMKSRHHSYYPGALNSHRSMYNGRSGSPMSVRSIDSNMSVSAKDIALAFQNGNFNKFEMKMIKDAYTNRFMKSRTRKNRVEKRRNIKMFLKGFRRKSGGDSGDQASNSSLSSDDCRSTRSSKYTLYKENMSSCRSTKTDISDFRRTMRDSNIVRDCTENFRQNSYNSMVLEGPNKDKGKWLELQQKWRNSSISSSLTHLQKDRFKNNFLLPSQRFDQSVASLPILEKPNRLQRINECNTLDIQNNVRNQVERNGKRNVDTDSEQEEIFADVTVMEKTSISNKRNLEEDDIPVPNKKSKLSPPKNNPKPKTPKQNQQKGVTKSNCNDFVFAKPQFPLKKPTITKQQKVVTKTPKPVTQVSKEKQSTTELFTSVAIHNEKVITSSQKAVEKLISNSSQPLEKVHTDSGNSTVQELYHSVPQEKEQTLPNDLTQQSTTDMSMRPSFIKRKLFTQKIDIAEKNLSSDSLNANSPQTNVYSRIQKEKNRARKLVTTQSCLSRDVHDDSNLLDLIHKIVPAEQMNVTTVINRTETQNNKSKPINAEKWDVTSVISKNTDEFSDTYTDEDIFAGGEDSEKLQQNKINMQNNNETQNHTKVNQKTKNKSPEIKKKSDMENIEKTKKSSKLNDQTKNKPTETRKKAVCDIKEKSVDGKDKAINDVRQKVTQNIKTSKCQVVVEKLQPRNFKGLDISTLNDQVSAAERNDLIKACVYKGVKSFWDTDAESDFEATPLKRADCSNAVITINSVNKVNNPPVSELAPSNMKQTTQKKTITNQKSITKQKENKLNNQSQKTKNNIEIADKIIENKPAQKDIKTNKKALSASTKENKPPDVDYNKTINNEAKNMLNKLKKNDEQHKLIKKTTMNKAKPHINNNDSTLDNNESQHIKIHNNTLRIRAQRKPKVNRCCKETDSSYQSETNNNISLCRSLRSRQVDLSKHLKSDDGDINVIKETAPKQKRPAKTNNNIRKGDGEKSLLSDVSFTLTTEVSTNKTMRNRKTSANPKDRNPRQSDVSFTLVTKNKTLNDTVSTRNSKRNRELESLQNNSASFMRYRKRSPLNKKMATESRAFDRSSNMRLNRSRRLL